jgi:hypothetical protein
MEEVESMTNTRRAPSGKRTRSLGTTITTTLPLIGALFLFACAKSADGNGAGRDGTPSSGQDGAISGADGSAMGGLDGSELFDGGEVPPNANVVVSGRLVNLGEYLARLQFAPAPTTNPPDAGAIDTGLADTGTTADAGAGLDGAIADGGGGDGGGGGGGGDGGGGDGGGGGGGGGGGDGGGGGGGGMLGDLHVGGASLLALGVTPAAATVSSDDMMLRGQFMLTLPQNGKLVLFANKAGYFPSYTPVVTGAVNIDNQFAFAAQSTYVNQLAAANQIDLTTPFKCHGPPIGNLSPMDDCVFAILIGQILDDGSKGAVLPVAGIRGQDMEIVGGDDNSPWYHRGPYFLTSTGAPSLDAIQSQVGTDPVTRYVRGGLFATFVEIPQIIGPPSVDFRISIRYDGGGGVIRYFGPTYLKAFRPYGVTFGRLLETGTPPPENQTGIDFATQVYPLFLPVAQGGLGCLGCHTSVNGATPTGNMDLSGGPAAAYDRALNPQMHSNRVNTANPSASLILVNPLYNPAGTNPHPIIAFSSVQDPSYKTILQWITEGAKKNGTGTMTSSAVSFAQRVAPIFQNEARLGGAGCVVCHSTQGGQTPMANFNVGTTPAELYDALVNQPATDQTLGQMFRIAKRAGDEDRSLVLVKPLQGNPAIHPVKLFSSNADPRYITIYRWIAEGYPNN